MTSDLSDRPAAPGAALRECGCPEQPNRASRRAFLKGMIGGGAFLAASGQDILTRVAFASTPSYTGDTLVVLSFRGGFDGLSAIVPAASADYAQYTTWRPGIAVPHASLIPLDAQFGMHPAMAALKPFYDAGTFGVVHAVGQVNPTRSHFEAMDEMERAAPNTTTRTGWIDRTLGLRAAGSPFQAVGMGDTMPPLSMAGPVPVITMDSVDSFQLNGPGTAAERATWTAALHGMYSGVDPLLAAPATTTLDALSTTATLKTAGYTPANGAVYDDTSDLASALRDVARLIKAGVGLQVAAIDYGDWDMHVNLGGLEATGWMTKKLTEVAGALAAFATDLGSAFSDVTLVTLSEFGRRVEQNGSGGVDHGHGNAVLLMGGGIVGGHVYGTWPGLADADLVDGDLAGTTDYRLVLGEILQKRCGAGSLSTVFPGLSGSALGLATQKP